MIIKISRNEMNKYLYHPYTVHTPNYIVIFVIGNESFYENVFYDFSQMTCKRIFKIINKTNYNIENMILHDKWSFLYSIIYY